MENINFGNGARNKRRKEKIIELRWDEMIIWEKERKEYYENERDSERTKEEGKRNREKAKVKQTGV